MRLGGQGERFDADGAYVRRWVPELARLPDLQVFAREHGLKIGTIRDLIAYRRRYDSIVKRISETALDSTWGGDFRCVVYVNKVTMAQHVAPSTITTVLSSMIMNSPKETAASVHHLRCSPWNVLGLMLASPRSGRC